MIRVLGFFSLYRIVATAFVMIIFVSCHQNLNDDSSAASLEKVEEPLGDLILPEKEYLELDDIQLVEVFVGYCSSCHATSELNFLPDHLIETDIIAALFIEKAPRSKKIWASSMVEVLSWPEDKIFSFETEKLDETRRFMPLGAKKFAMDEALIEGKSLRKTLIYNLKTRLKNMEAISAESNTGTNTGTNTESKNSESIEGDNHGS